MFVRCRAIALLAQVCSDLHWLQVVHGDFDVSPDAGEGGDRFYLGVVVDSRIALGQQPGDDWRRSRAMDPTCFMRPSLFEPYLAVSPASSLAPGPIRRHDSSDPPPADLQSVGRSPTRPAGSSFIATRASSAAFVRSVMESPFAEDTRGLSPAGSQSSLGTTPRHRAPM